MKEYRIKTIKEPHKMLGYWKREWKVVLLVAISGTVFDSCMSLGAILQGRLIDALVDGFLLPEIIKACAIFFGTILLIQLMRGMKRYYVRVFANRTNAAMRLVVYRNIMQREAQDLMKESTGDLMTKTISDVGICVEGMRKGTTEVFDTGILMLSYCITLFSYDTKLTFVAILFVPLAMWIAERLKKVIVKYSRQSREASSQAAQEIYDCIENIAVYRVNGLERENQRRYDKVLENLEKKTVKANVLENSMPPIYNAIAMTGIIFIIWFGGNKVIQGAWTIGDFSAYIIIFSALAVKASKTAKMFNSFQRASVSWKRIKPYLTETSGIQTNLSENESFNENADKELKINRKSNENSLCVSNLKLGIRDNEMKSINFEMRTGNLLGLTGPVACGKSTLGMLLQGMLPYEGNILLDGLELREYSAENRSKKIAYMGHQPELLSGTIYENITLGEDGDITSVLQDVCFEEDLESMPDGIHTYVGSGGVRLSGGQQARIALARALHRKSELYILDDPFSAVDMETERKIISNLQEHYKEAMIVLISHRLAIFPKADQVLLLHKGRGVEIGKHEELLQRSELYTTIYELQSITLEEK